MNIVNISSTVKGLPNDAFDEHLRLNEKRTTMSHRHHKLQDGSSLGRKLAH
jgi:hypothetical protein